MTASLLLQPFVEVTLAKCVKEQAEKGSQSPQMTVVSLAGDGLRFRGNERIAVRDQLE
jgi:hypothetical protein